MKRLRRIPANIRRAVIEKHIARTGGFDPATEEIDHMVPFEKGGGHTKDNLWIIPKKVRRETRCPCPRIGCALPSAGADGRPQPRSEKYPVEIRGRLSPSWLGIFAQIPGLP
jgi:hypothetical protein